jgi:RNA polymerase sigma-70 factor (ECF subfamily)
MGREEPVLVQSDVTEELLARATAGDEEARQQLLAQHRDRLCRMVALRLDRRVAARIDPSDVVQEALLEASQRLSDYLRKRPIPFYPWLRQLAWERLVKLHQRHLQAQKRTVTREEIPPAGPELAITLAQRLVAPGSSPSKHVVLEEMRLRVRDTLKQLPERDREVLVLRFLEQLSTNEIAAVLKITPGAVKLRQLRALERLRTLLDVKENPEQ